MDSGVSQDEDCLLSSMYQLQHCLPASTFLVREGEKKW